MISMDVSLSYSIYPSIPSIFLNQGQAVDRVAIILRLKAKSFTGKLPVFLTKDSYKKRKDTKIFY